MKNIYLAILLTIFLYSNPIFAEKTLTLNESKQLALQNNAKSKNSKLEIEASREISNSAFTNYFPKIEAGGMGFKANESIMKMETHGGNLPVYDGNPQNLAHPTQYAYMPGSTIGLLSQAYIGYLNVVQPVYAGGRIVNGNKLASLGEKASELKDKLNGNEILQTTEERYWQIVSLEEKLKTIKSYENFLARLLSQVEDAYKSGIVMKNDVLKVKLKQSEVLLNKSKLENGIKMASMAFCQYVGLPYDSTLILTDELSNPDLPQNYFTEPGKALLQRSEYNLLGLSVESEKLQTKMKEGEFLPQVGVGVSGMYMKMDESESRTLAMAFGTVSIPISGWWGGSHELEERKIKEEIAGNNFSNNSELLLLQMEKSWQDLTDAYKQYLLSEESKEQAEENIKVNEDSYKNGLITLSDLLEAQAMLQQTQDQLTDAKTGYLVKKSAYLKATAR